MATSREHVTALPRGFIIVRILQVIFTIAVIPLASLIYSFYGHWYGDWAPLGLIIGAVISLLVLVWIILSTYVFPRAYNYWALLVIEILFTGFWALGFCLATGSGFNPANRGCRLYWDYKTQRYQNYCPTITNEALFQAAGHSGYPLLGFASGLVVLWLTSFIVVAVFIARHRKEAKRCKQES